MIVIQIAQQQFVCCRPRNSTGGSGTSFSPSIPFSLILSNPLLHPRFSSKCAILPIAGYCPSGQTVELLPSGSPKNCLVQACSSGRTCVYSSTANGSVCCGNTFG